jgi:predicted O-methyltransferase YrrM
MFHGWLTTQEARLLFDLAAAAAPFGRIVELGSYCGRSTSVLAAGLHLVQPEERLVAVDTFRGSPENQPDREAFHQELRVADGSGVDSYPQFCRNLIRVNLLDSVQVERRTTAEAAAEWREPVALLFVDADHAYDSVRGDLDGWLPHLVGQGVVVLHDVGDWSGPTRSAADLIDLGYRRIAVRGTALALARP